jgi:anti-sigma regulatory factor (Ser/Thr protein kinase)
MTFDHGGYPTAMSTTMTGFQRVGVSGGAAASAGGLADELAVVASESLDRAEPVVAVVDHVTEARMRARLGRRARQVGFTRPERAYPGFSGQSAAVARARELGRLAEHGRCTTIERHRPWGPGAPRGTFWLELAAALDLALEGMPVTMVCGLDADAAGHRLPAAADHPFLRTRGVAVPNPGHRARGPAELTFDPPPRLGPALFALGFDAGRLRGLRPRLSRWAAGAGLPAEPCEMFVLAASEVATNSVEHGGGTGTLAAWSTAAELIVEVSDRGRISHPLHGLRRPAPQQARGRGLWMARQVCPLMHVWSTPSGTHVRLAVPCGPAHRS